MGPPVIDPDNPPDWLALANRCEHPRQGSFDAQGKLMDELKWLRSFYDETYLWYRELPANLDLKNFARPIDFFNAYKTSAVTARVRPLPASLAVSSRGSRRRPARATA